MNNTYRLSVTDAGAMRPRIKIITGSTDTVETAVNQFLATLWSVADYPVRLESVTVTATPHRGSGGAPWIIATIFYHGPDLS